MQEDKKASNYNFIYGIIIGVILYKVFFDVLLPMISQ